ncbi:glucose-1-phosphate cytidylyltransferase [bacterium]|nr:glucose-1-phosphate cytidylyltransferase [bacterium]
MLCHNAPVKRSTGHKVVILAGGLGTRLSEETERRPKPMVEIGGQPILWHILQHYARYGFKEFVIALGYKGETVKKYFLDYHALQGDLTVSVGTGRVTVHKRRHDDWTVHLIDTGPEVLTGGRLLRLKPFLGRSTFLLTYGDGVSDVDLKKLIALHRKSKSLVTLTAVRPPARFGGIEFDKDRVVRFLEKHQISEGWINGGFMVMEPGVFDYLKSDQSVLEKDLLETAAGRGRLAAYRHPGFWHGMDTLRDVKYLDGLAKSGEAPWIKR